LCLEILRVDVFDIDLRIRLKTCVPQRFVEGFIGVYKIGVLTHHAHLDGCASGRELFRNHIIPLAEIHLARRHAKALENVVVEPLFVKAFRNLVDRICVEYRNYCALFNVSKERDFAARTFIDIYRATAEQHICLKAD